MDPAQRAHEPGRPVKPADLIRTLHADPVLVEENPDAAQAIAENRATASAELAMIFELKESVAHQWFLEQFIAGPFRDASDALKSANTKLEELAAVQTRYVTLRPIMAGIIEREIAHRDQLDPNDQEVFRLRERLRLL